jgi:hypothetical protein
MGTRHRKEGLEYGLNELFVEVREEVNLTMRRAAEPGISLVEGKVNMSDYLSGMPDVEIAFNDRVRFGSKDAVVSQTIGSRRDFDLEEVHFHACVTRTGLDGLLEFVPPDGDFCLVTYRVSGAVKPPICVDAQLEGEELLFTA